MILVAGAVVWHPDDMDVRCGVRTAQLVYKERLAVLYEEGSNVRTVNGFVLLTSRSWFGVCIAKISPKKLGDYNCLITGI